jgi:hypothetical protein
MESPMDFVRALVVIVAAWCWLGGVAEARPLVVRVQWGGGTPHAWAGTVEVVAAGPTGAATRIPFSTRTTCTDADAAALIDVAADVVHVHHPRPVASDGVEITVEHWRAARLVARLSAADGGRPITLDVPLVELVTAPAQQPLDALGNRVTARVPADDALHVEAGAAEAQDRVALEGLGLLRRPGDRLRLKVTPILATRLQGGHAAELRMRLRSPQGGESAAQATPLVPHADPAGTPADLDFTEFDAVEFDVTLPADDGVCTIELEAVERGGLRWSRPLATRSIEIAAIGDAPPAPPASEPWKTVYELDPGSPRLLERLRRLPGMSLPSVPLPEMPLPSLSMASVPLPKLPSMPMPAVPMPNVSGMVPRLSGPLSHGHSTLVTHPLGPMLRLPPATRQAEPAWEGIVLAGLQVGMPHAVEIDHPVDQDATVGVAVLEPDAAGVVVQSRHAGGFEVERPLLPPVTPQMATHRFVFWPTTRQPLLLISNPSVRHAATIGRVRVMAGPTLVPREPSRTPATLLSKAGAAGRRVHAFLDSPDVATRFGGGARFVPQDGRLVVDWASQVAAGRHLVEVAAAQDVAGTMLTAYAGGAALWPSAATRHAPRWHASEVGIDRDVLATVTRLHARQGLSLIPAARFDAPLPAVEALLVGGGVGAACVGRDGKPRRLSAGGLHYNVLHPAVQRAVEEVIVEMAGRVRGSPAVTGIAVVMPNDGWLHLPGLAWPLDDDTFSRFAATLPSPPVAEGESRFAERARLVEGPFREAWIAWRCGEIARFHARLAESIAAVDARWSLHVVPTTLFARDDPAGVKQASASDSDPDRVRTFGLDPASLRSLPAADRVVYAWPWVHAAASGVREQAAIAAANRHPAVARAAAQALRSSAVVIEQPLAIDADDAVRHAPFGTATVRDAVAVCPLAPEPRGFAEALSVADVETVFHAGLLADLGPRSATRASFEALPAAASRPVLAADRPLSVRVSRRPGMTWAVVANAAAAPVTARLAIEGGAASKVDAVDGQSVAGGGPAEAVVRLDPWGVRCVLLEGECGVVAARAEYGDDVRREVAGRVNGLRQRRAVLETPVPLDVLDNPAFELGAAPADGKPAATIAGWEVVEPRRGSLALVPGGGGAEEPGRALEFSSSNGLATLRSNPFAAPASGRISVAAWLRVADPSVQPPLRIAIEGVQGDREYYRFAAIGGLTGGRPLTGQWSQFVLQVDDLPADAVESLRVRFDLLGPGRVQIDDVRVFDLAFDDSQRSEITKAVSLLEHQAAADEIGAALASLDGLWPSFLEAFVSDAAVAATQAASQPEPTPSEVAPQAPERQAGGMLDRFRSWWQ